MSKPPLSRAEVVTARELPLKIEKAVSLAHQRLKIPGEVGQIVRRWDIYGKVVRNPAVGEVFAEEVSSNLRSLGVPAVPTLIKIDKKILAGFIEKPLIQPQRIV